MKPPPDQELEAIFKEFGIRGIEYKYAVPDFAPVAKETVEIEHMLGGKGMLGKKARAANYLQADVELANYLNKNPEQAKRYGMEAGKIRKSQISTYRRRYKLTWHELNDGKTLQLVPTVINKAFLHLGGVGEINKGLFLR